VVDTILALCRLRGTGGDGWAWMICVGNVGDRNPLARLAVGGACVGLPALSVRMAAL